MSDILKIDYDNSILSISNSLLKYYHIKPYHSTLKILDEKLRKQHKNIIFMILDGMGCEMLEKNLPENSFIRRHIAAEISSVFPPTTSAATTAMHSGLSPWESGWLGWMCYYKEYDEFIENFRNKAYYSGKELDTPCPKDSVLKYTPIYERIIEKNPSVEYHKIFPPFEAGGVENFSQMCGKIIELSRNSNRSKIFSAYWHEPDHTAHDCGASSPELKEILTNIDTNLQYLYNNLQDSLLIVSADHGHTDVEEVYLNSYPKLCSSFLRPPALESRFKTFFIKPNKLQLFQTEFEKAFAQDFHLFTKKEFMESGLLGSGKMHPRVPDFLGDFVAIATGRRMLRYSTGEKAHAINKSDHSGFSAAELSVPLLLLEKE